MNTEKNGYNFYKVKKLSFSLLSLKDLKHFQTLKICLENIRKACVIGIFHLIICSNYINGYVCSFLFLLEGNCLYNIIDCYIVCIL